MMLRLFRLLDSRYNRNFQLLSPMDFSAFNRDDFDLKAWINSALDSKDPQEPIDAHVTVVAMKLQLLAQELNNSIEDSSSKAISSVPRGLREIERLIRESSNLNGSLSTVVQNVEEFEEKTYNSVRLIALLDQTKARMISTSRLLRQATRVQAFRRDVDNIFATEDHELIADNICEARETAQALTIMPEYKGLKQEIEELSDRLVDAMQKPLNDAIVARDAEAAQKLTAILRKIERDSQIRSMYVSLRRKPFAQYWSSQVLNTADAAPLSDRLSAFFDSTMRALKEETAWLVQAFPPPMEPRGLACALISDSLRSLAVDMRGQIDSALKSESTKLTRLAEYHDLARRFSTNIQSILRGSNEDDIGDVMLSIFEPFFRYEEGFNTLLKAEIGAYSPMKKLFGDVVRGIEDEVIRLFLNCEASVESCLKFNGGAEMSSLLVVLNELLTQYADRIEGIIGKTRALMNLPATTNIEYQGNMKVPDDKWARFQHVMLLAQSTFSATKRLVSFEIEMRGKLREVRDSLLDGTALALKSAEQSLNCASHVPVGLLHILSQTDRLRKLRALLHSLDDTHYRLLGGAARRFTQIHSEAQKFVFDVMYEPIRLVLDAYPGIDEWEAQPEASEYENVDLPMFSQSPTVLVTTIGEYMITLPQQLEPFEESGFTIDIAVLGPGVESVSVEAVTGFGALWLSLLAYRTAGEYVVKILEIKSASATGKKQMIADVGYISNVLTALGMPVMPAMSQLSRLLAATDTEAYHEVVKEIVSPNENTASKSGLSVADIQALSQILGE